MENLKLKRARAYINVISHYTSRADEVQHLIDLETDTEKIDNLEVKFAKLELKRIRLTNRFLKYYVKMMQL